MKKLMCLVSVVLLSIPLAGCATRGRFAVLDLDLRDKDQIIAYQTEATCIYQPAQQPVAGVPLKEQPAVSLPWWNFLFDFLKVMKGRIRVLSFEWQE